MIPNADLIEDRFRESLARYIVSGVPTGDFLAAVLSNDLKESVGRADWLALENIPHIVSWLYNRAPGPCWGSPERVKEWLAMDPARRRRAASGEAVEHGYWPGDDNHE